MPVCEGHLECGKSATLRIKTSQGDRRTRHDYVTTILWAADDPAPAGWSKAQALCTEHAGGLIGNLLEVMA